jgi:hypothetical protein
MLCFEVTPMLPAHHADLLQPAEVEWAIQQSTAKQDLHAEPVLGLFVVIHHLVNCYHGAEYYL